MTIAARVLHRPRVAVGPAPGWLQEGGAAWVATRLALAASLVAAYIVAANTGHRGVSLARWDTNWYTGIAQHGYTVPQRANFFPLLPLLEAGLGRVLAGGQDPSTTQLLAAGLIVSAVAALVAFCAFAALVELEADRPTARAAVRVLAVYPFAVFLGAAYTDGPFLAMALVYFLAVRRRQWWAAGAAGVAAGLLRSVAPLLGIALLAELAFEVVSRKTVFETLKGSLLAVLSTGAGVGLYSAYLWYRFGDPLLFVHTQTRYWHHAFAWPWQTLVLAFQHLSLRHPGLLPLELGLVIFFAALAIGALIRLRPAYGVFTAGLVLAVLFSPEPAGRDVISSTGRYLLPAFPAFWMVARSVVGRPWLEFAILAICFPLQAAFTVLFVLGGPIY